MVGQSRCSDKDIMERRREVTNKVAPVRTTKGHPVTFREQRSTKEMMFTCIIMWLVLNTVDREILILKIICMKNSHGCLIYSFTSICKLIMYHEYILHDRISRLHLTYNLHLTIHVNKQTLNLKQKGSHNA